MNIYEIATKFDLSIRKVRRMEKAGIFKKSGSEDSIVSKMSYALGKGNRLSAINLAALVEDSNLVYELGPYFEKADEQVRNLGNVRDEIAQDAWAHVDLAANDDPAAVERMIRWMKSVIPHDHEVPYEYLAVRILLAKTGGVRKYLAARMPRAILNCRKNPDFANWVALKPNKYGHNATVFRRPEIPYDL
ncbi:hypothetical protein [Sphingopyxis fribergensis]